MKKFLIVLFALSIFILGCATVATTVGGEAKVTNAVARILPTDGNNVSGLINFVEVGGSLKITGQIRGLSPGKHGIHIHEYGNLSDMETGNSAGEHFNPDHKAHGAPNLRDSHAGDLGNIEANADGIAPVDITNDFLKLNGRFSVIGRAIVIHEGEGDYVGQPSGNSGKRIGIGVIGISMSSPNPFDMKK